MENNTIVSDFVKKWNGKNLEDWGCEVSKQYKTFQKAFNTIIKKIATNNKAKLVKNYNGHYYMSGFIERNGKYVYYNYSGDISKRAVPNLTFNDSILIRTAKNDRDFSGGTNKYTSFVNFENKLNELLNEE